MRHRWGLLGIILAVAVGAAAIGWIVGREVQSPDEAATEREPPEASLIAVPVESRVLNSNVVVRGDIRFSESEELSVDPGIAVGDAAVVTGQLPAEGADLEEGDVFIEVSGRPVIALIGELPMFRTLSPGSAGDDVLQLEEALARLGHDPGEIDGIFDAATEDAVEAEYRELGYPPPGLDEQEAAQLRAAEDAVEMLRDQLRDAEADLARASKGLSKAERLGLDQSLFEARRLLDTVKADAEAQVTAAREAVEAARTTRDVSRAARDLAVDRLQQAEAGTHPDTGLPPSAEELAELKKGVAVARSSFRAARDALEAAKAQRTSTKEETDAQITSANFSLQITLASRAEALAAPDTTFQRRAVDETKAALESAREELAEIDARLGTEMPKTEVVFLDVLPRRIDRVLVERGDVVTGPVMRISGAEIVIDSSVAAADRPLVSVGDRVILDEEALGIVLDGEITELADEPGGPDTGENRYYMQVVPDGGDPLQLRGLNVRLTIPVESTAGEVLAVPLAALSAGPDGSARVQVERSPGQTDLVRVVVGLSAEGYVEIDPIEATVVAGDLVVVGRE